MLYFLAALAVPPALAETEPEPALTTLSSSYTRVSPVVTSALAEAITERAWKSVISLLDATDRTKLNNAQQREADFLWMWAQVHGGSPEKAIVRIEALDGVLSVPAAYLNLIRGEALLADEQAVEALAALAKIPEGSPIHERAALLQAKTLKELNRSAEALALYESMASRPGNSPGTALALYAVALQKGVGSAAAYPPLRRLWTEFPATREGRRAAKALGRYGSTAKYQPTREERSLRAEQLMYSYRYDDAIEAADALLAKGLQKDVSTCRALFARGRSYYKKNQLSNAVTGMGDAGDRCVGLEGAYGAKALYLLGTAQFRRKRFSSSAKAFLKLPANYAEHTMADDGYTHAGISLQEADQLPEAQALWRKALEELPDGDTVPEATWRLAWSLYLSGDTAEARMLAERLSGLEGAKPIQREAGAYWAARWSVFPDVSKPTEPDPEGRQAGIDGLVAFVEQYPHSFYSILAASRLKSLAPERLAALQKVRVEGPEKRPWEVRLTVLESEAVRNGVALARLGLAREAIAEWDRFEGTFSTDEKTWLYSLRAEAGDWLRAHHDMRRWLKKHPLESNGVGERAVIRVAYPDRYWAEVQTASKGYHYDPRLFHSLVREESNFNRKIVSFAGARGLSQLMPATARTTAGWMGKSVTMADLFEPEKNLPIGARYLDSVITKLDGSPYCALAGYNAGPNRVLQWKAAWGNVPTDEFVERIPFRETRGYVKRVMGTWQMYRWYIEDGEPFADLSAYNNKMLPKH